MSDHHSSLSPSSFPAILQCACYVAGAPSEAADRGTAQHECLAQMLTSPKRDSCLGLSEEEVDGVTWAYEYIQAHASSGTPLQVEQKLVLIDEWTFEEITYGRADAYSKPDLFDLKSGQDHGYEAQMAVYALMFMQRDGLPSVRVHELYSKTKYPKVTTITQEDAWTVVKKVISRRQDPNRKETPCDYCSWCGRAAVCGALNKRAIEVGKNREDWELSNYHSSEIAEPSEMSKALILARQLKSWVDSVEFQAKDMALRQGIKIPLFTLTKKSGAREIVDIGKAFQGAGLPQDKFLSCCEVRITKLEKGYAEFHGMKSTAAGRKLEEQLGDCIQRKPDIFMLVKEKTLKPELTEEEKLKAVVSVFEKERAEAEEQKKEENANA